MATELEAKLKVESLDAARAALRSAGASRLGSRHETNTMLDRPADPLAPRDAALRVRACCVLDGPPQSARLTFKGPANASRFKSREELEVAVDDAGETIRILEALGFVVTMLYEKRRETWRLGPCTVEVDELPELGAFIEIEGPDEAAVAAAKRQLQMDDAPHIAGSYVRLLLERAGDGRRVFRLAD